MDPMWEFNANQYVDFNRLDDEDNTNADEFFDYDMESGERVEKDDASFQSGDKPAVESEPTPTSTEEPKPRKPSNMVTSWGPGVTKVTANSKTAKPDLSKGQNPPKSLTVPHSGAVKPRAMTPRRAHLKAQVEASIASVRSSPWSPRRPKRLGTNTSEPRLASSRTRTSSNQSQVNRYQSNLGSLLLDPSLLGGNLGLLLTEAMDASTCHI
eukprot:GFUD01107613.1.p1 GENE.GFUD01107613.1~~GFUD01107613.1.p1  ORF type:complete len:211 (+),score=43.45 GFUD01107613.1:59-691(+)